MRKPLLNLTLNLALAATTTIAYTHTYAATDPTSTTDATDTTINAPSLYAQHCAGCHGAQRTGLMGPALLPESLERLRRPEALKVITSGRPATQMQGFQNQIKPEEIAALAQWIYTPVSPAPRWSEEDIRSSRVALANTSTLADKPVWQADPMNLFVVVEGGDHHVSLVDGDKFERIHRFASRFALHGGPKFTPDGRFVFFGSRDGWITKYDLWNLTTIAEVRAGLNMRNVAVSSDGKWVMAANYLPHTLALFDADLKLVKTFAAATLDGSASSRVSAVYDAAPRRSFIVALKDIPELWEISYDPKAEPIHDGLVHDYKMGEAIAKPGYLGVRRTPLDEPLDDFFFDQSYRHALGATRPKADGQASAQVVNLDVRRKIADLPIAGMPHLGSGITWAWNGTTVLASPNLKGNAIDVIDKTTLEPVAKVTEPGKTLAHIEFTKDGRYALASLWEMDGALIVYDAQTLKEVKRLPMKKPVGKYNVWNKITRSEGTSH